MTHQPPRPTIFSASGPLSGAARVPGDKSISHRALMLSAMARGRSRIAGLSEGADVASTAGALQAMGARIERTEDGIRIVDGVGSGCLIQPEAALDMGNSGTSARLLAGLIASHPIQATLIGDASLSRRPMGRVIEPLSRIGAEFIASPGGRLPLTIRGICPAVPREHRLQVASAQVKSALLLAGLNTPGRTRVIETVPTRDHSERMLKRFGADLRIERDGGDTIIDLTGEAELKPQDFAVPGDPSAAAFLVTAALIVSGSDVRVEGIGINPLRVGYFNILRKMGADLRIENEREEAGEPVADIVARHSPLRAVEVPPEVAASMIDEFPIFFVAAAFAEGTSRTSGLEELRVKESDRIAVMAEALTAIGARVEERPDGMIVHGSAGEPLAGGATIAARLDHRIAMSGAIAALACRAPVSIDDMAPVDTSFPGFAATLASLAQ
ncbi:MAG TPA: 3-phosphoshikimate 1-carboxyvinyltransferase [Allosphingosinicella sp.]|nr:3-phosphoshikimate 1-carboxyvinyltransferase [Allosphingosinicella sp.]